MKSPRQQMLEERGAPGKNGKRGSVNNASRLAGLSQSSAVTGKADWGNASKDWLAAVVVAATLRGFIVSFSLSRDGGAHGLQLYGDGERAQLWFNGDAELDLELERIFVYLEGLS